MSFSRILSLVVAGGYLLVSLLQLYLSEQWENLKGVIALMAWIALSLVCIWYSEEIGSLTGAKYGLVSSSSPGWAVEIMGWILLILPFVVFIIWAIAGLD